MTIKYSPALFFSEQQYAKLPLKEIIASISSGVSVNSDGIPISSKDEIGILKTSCVSNGFFHSYKNKKVNYKEIDRVKQPVEAGTIIVSRMNTPKLVGEIGYVVKSMPNLFLPDRLWSVKPNDNFCSYWLSCYLISPRIKYQLKELATGTSGSMKNISQQSFLAIEVSYPDLEEQQKIADFLTSVDTKISQLTEKHRLLKEYKKGVMQQIFSQKIRFKNDKDEDFPDWKAIEFSTFLKPTIRKVPKPSNKFLSLGVRCHVKGTFQKPNFEPQDIALDELFEVKSKDLIVNITFAWEGAIAIASTEDEGGLVSHRFPTYVFNTKKVIPDYFQHIIQEKRLRYMLCNISPGGAGRNRVLNKSDFLKLKWNLPSVSEQQKIAEFLQALDNKNNAVAEQIAQTKAFKQGLLQQMFV